jgi:hypothetical protein
MFAFFVLGQRPFGVEPVIALIALELPQVIVNPQVFLEPRRHHFTANVASLGFGSPVVVLQMRVEILLRDEFLVAHAAREILHPVVVVDVSLEVLLPHESSITDGANEGQFAVVDLHVEVQVAQSLVRLVALCAGVLFVGAVANLMGLVV